MFRNKSVKLV